MPAEYDWGIYTTYPKSLYKGVLERGIVLSSASLLLVEYLNIITLTFYEFTFSQDKMQLHSILCLIMFSESILHIVFYAPFMK